MVDVMSNSSLIPCKHPDRCGVSLHRRGSESAVNCGKGPAVATTVPKQATAGLGIASIQRPTPRTDVTSVPKFPTQAELDGTAQVSDRGLGIEMLRASGAEELEKRTQERAAQAVVATHLWQGLQGDGNQPLESVAITNQWQRYAGREADVSVTDLRRIRNFEPGDETTPLRKFVALPDWKRETLQGHVTPGSAIVATEWAASRGQLTETDVNQILESPEKYTKEWLGAAAPNLEGPQNMFARANMKSAAGRGLPASVTAATLDRVVSDPDAARGYFAGNPHRGDGKAATRYFQLQPSTRTQKEAYDGMVAAEYAAEVLPEIKARAMFAATTLVPETEQPAERAYRSAVLSGILKNARGWEEPIPRKDIERVLNETDPDNDSVLYEHLSVYTRKRY